MYASGFFPLVSAVQRNAMMHAQDVELDHDVDVDVDVDDKSDGSVEQHEENGDGRRKNGTFSTFFSPYYTSKLSWLFL